jgi:RNA polymerase sigma factor (sigma-70 family)
VFRPIGLVEEGRSQGGSAEASVRRPVLPGDPHLRHSSQGGERLTFRRSRASTDHEAIDVPRAGTRRAIPVAQVPERASAQRADARDLDLDAALAALPRRQREAVAYHYLAGLPYQDVAAVIGGSTDAARRSAADGIAKLRRRYPGPAVQNVQKGSTP